MSRKNIIIVVPILVVLVGIGLFLLSPGSPQPAAPQETPGTSSTPPPGSPNQTQTPQTPSSIPPQPAGTSKSYRNSKIGLAFTYADRYFISSVVEDTDETLLVLNKVADKKQLGTGLLDRTAHIRISVLSDTAGQLLSEFVTKWGSVITGARFSTNESCRAKNVAGESALSCSVYGGVERGGYRDGVFFKHRGRIFSFEASSPTNGDIVHTDLSRILTSITWTN